MEFKPSDLANTSSCNITPILSSFFFSLSSHLCFLYLHALMFRPPSWLTCANWSPSLPHLSTAVSRKAGKHHPLTVLPQLVPVPGAQKRSECQRAWDSASTYPWVNGNNQQRSDGITSSKQTQCSLTECLLMSDRTPKATSRKGPSTDFPEAVMVLQGMTPNQIAEADAGNTPALSEVSFTLVVWGSFRCYFTKANEWNLERASSFRWEDTQCRDIWQINV